MNEIDYKFVLSDELLQINFDINNLNQSMQKLGGLISKIFEEPKAGIFIKDLGQASLFENHGFYELIYSRESPLDKDFKRSLSAIMNSARIIQWNKELLPNECVKNLVERCLHDGEIISLLGFVQELRGDCGFLLVCDEQSLLKFYRKAPEYEDSNPERFIEHAKRGFPRLYFMPDIHRGIDDFHEPYHSIRDKITVGLAYLNDKFIEDSNEVRFMPDQIQARFRPCCTSLCGISPESANTMGVERKKRLRVVQVNGQDVVCEWHVKISSQYDRIHFAYEDTYRKMVGDRIIIGIFTKHLET